MLAILLIISKWLGLAGMATTAVSGVFGPEVLGRQGHYLAGMVSTFLYALAQVMTTYYFIGMRTAVVRAVAKHDLDAAMAEEAQAIKRSVGRMGHFLPLVATAALIAAGGALTGTLPGWIHWSLGAATIILGIGSAVTEFRAFRRNAALIDRTAAQIPQTRPSQ